MSSALPRECSSVTSSAVKGKNEMDESLICPSKDSAALNFPNWTSDPCSGSNSVLLYVIYVWRRAYRGLRLSVYVEGQL